MSTKEKIRYGVTVIRIVDGRGERVRTKDETGTKLSYETRKGALQAAACKADLLDARVVRLKRKAKPKPANIVHATVLEGMAKWDEHRLGLLVEGVDLRCYIVGQCFGAHSHEGALLRITISELAP